MGVRSLGFPTANKVTPPPDPTSARVIVLARSRSARVDRSEHSGPADTRPDRPPPYRGCNRDVARPDTGAADTTPDGHPLNAGVTAPNPDQAPASAEVTRELRPRPDPELRVDARQVHFDRL